MNVKNLRSVKHEISLLFVKFFSFIRSNEVRDLCRKKPTHFTRIYKFPWFDVLLFLIFRSETCIPSEISKYYSAINKTSLRISRQAAFKALKKVNPRVFPSLIRKFAELFYSSNLVKDYKGYILWAEDGTTLNLYKTPESIAKFGYVKNHIVKIEGEAAKATSQSAALYDVTNGLIVNFTMEPYVKSEIPIAINQLEESFNLINGRKVIYLADRYYDSIELFAILENSGFNYCVRGKSNFFKHYVQKMKTNDEWINVHINDTWQKRLKYEISKERFAKNPYMQIRIVKVKLSYKIKHIDYSEDIIYFTNLSNEDFNTFEIIELYAKRWQIESSYKTMKSEYELERYFSLNCDTEICAIWGKVIFHNIVGIVRKCLDVDLATDPSPNYVYIANVKQLSKIVHDETICRWMRNANVRRIDSVIDMIDENKHKIKVPIRPDRHYKRWGQHVSSSNPMRFRYDGRNHPNVIYVNNHMQTTKPC